MKKILSVLFALVVIINCNIPVVSAASTDVESIYVYDDQNVVSDSTIAYIETMNQKFEDKNIKSKFAIVISDKLPDNYDEYVKSLFLEYEMSYAENSYDVLLYMALEDKRYDIEYGGGFVNGTLIYDDLVLAMIGEGVKNLLYDEQYDEAVLKIATYFNQIMDNQYNGIYAEREIRNEKYKFIFAFILIALMVTVVLVYAIQEKRKSGVQNNVSTENIESNKDELST